MSTVIKSKARVFGECINTHELLQALKSAVLNDDNAPVHISTPGYNGPVSMVLICPHCERLHLTGRILDEGTYLEKRIESKVFADHNSEKEGITKRELISILEALPNIIDVALADFTEHSYKLTGVYKCTGTCPVIHLDSSYVNDCLYLN